MTSTDHFIAAAAVVVLAGAVALVSLVPPAPTGGRDLPAFQYPAHMERWAWSLQSSTDLVTWTTEISWPGGLVASGAVNIVRSGQMKFYRMKGTP